MYSGPSRGGVRGGADRFSWEDVKSDKYRENYLGHSVKAPLGRWQKGRDLTWYAKDKKAPNLISDQEKELLELVKKQEQEMLLEQIGARPKRTRQATEGIDNTKLKEVLARGQVERDEKFDVGRVSGLGCGPSYHHTEMGPVQSVVATNWADSAPETNLQFGQVEQSRKKTKEDKASKEERKRDKKEKKAARKAAKKQRARHDSPDRSVSPKRRRQDSSDRTTRKRHDSPDARDRSRSLKPAQQRSMFDKQSENVAKGFHLKIGLLAVRGADYASLAKGNAAALDTLERDFRHCLQSQNRLVSCSTGWCSGPFVFMHDEGAEIICHKHEMGASVRHVYLDKLSSSSHAFSKLDGRQFRVRSENYESAGKKIASDSNMAEIVGIDVFKTDHKLAHIMRHINVPDELLRPNNHESDLPRLFVVNFMLPGYAPSNPVWGKSKIDGKGYSVVFYIKINSELDNAECKAADLLKRFLQMDCISEQDFQLRSRLKGIPILLNPEIVKVGLPLRQLIKKYSGKPFLTGPKYHYYTKTDAYLECDIDVHQWIYPARKSLHILLPEIAQMEFDFGFVIEGHGEENPERMLCSVRLRHIDPVNAVHIMTHQ